MNNREKFLALLEDTDRETLQRVYDRAVAAQKSGRNTYTSFLSEREFMLFNERKKNIDEVPHTSFGGYEGAMRVMLSFGEDEACFPIKAVKITGKGIETLSHPDFLGSIISLGLERNRIGDIIVGKEYCTVFCTDNTALLLKEDLREVGGVYVSAEIFEPDEIEVKQSFEEITGSVASLRADAVVSVMLKTSRTKAADLIAAQRFYLNQALCTRCDCEIKEGDILTVRKYGKAVVSEIGGHSKKGRTYVTLKKYA